jgi:hypothetical protein
VSNFLTGGEGERVVRERPRSCSCVALNKDSQCCGMQLVGLTRVFFNLHPSRDYMHCNLLRKKEYPSSGKY